MNSAETTVDRAHGAKHRLRPALVALVAGLLLVALPPASALAGGAGIEYGDPDLGAGNGGPRGDFDLSDRFDPSAPAPAPGAPAPVAPTTTTPVVDPAAAEAAERAARRKERRQRERREARRAVTKAAKAVAGEAGLSTAPPVNGDEDGTETAAAISRTAFESDGSGPLPMVAGVLLLLTGVGLVVRGRRPGRHEA